MVSGHLPPGVVSRLSGVCALLLFVLAGLPALAEEESINLDGVSGKESQVKVVLKSSSPTTYVEKFTNRAVGCAFEFAWDSAGPDGFSSATDIGTGSGVGVKWKWKTTWTVSRNSCGGSGPTCLRASCTTCVGSCGTVSNVPVPGRKTTSSGVTGGTESLTSSIITFFNPDEELVRFDSFVEQLAVDNFRFVTRVTNFTPFAVFFDMPATPEGCDPNPATCPPAMCPGPSCVTPLCVPCDFPGFSGFVGSTDAEGDATPTFLELETFEPHPGTEVPGGVTVCGAAIPKGTALCSNLDTGSSGIFNKIVPDRDVTIGSVFLSVSQVVVDDDDVNGLVGAGEEADLHISLVNAGPMSVVGATATLSTKDRKITILSGTSNYPVIPGFAPGGLPATNLTPFRIRVKPQHREDVSSLFKLTVSSLGMTGVEVPFVLGIGNDPTE